MARSLAPPNTEPEDRSRRFYGLTDLLAGGHDLPAIAKGLYPGSTRKVRHQRRDFIRRVVYTAGTDKDFQAALAATGRAELLLAVPAAAAGLARRAAATGRPDAVKLLFEATGFHNPRVKHEHSGDIKIKVDMPRPVRQIEGSAEEITDAEVVED